MLLIYDFYSSAFSFWFFKDCLDFDPVSGLQVGALQGRL
jgi:hypothetical protein